MAEEQAFPYSHWLAKIHPRFGVPWNMMLVIFAAEIVVGEFLSDLEYILEPRLDC